jgi:hypothetical protein
MLAGKRVVGGQVDISHHVAWEGDGGGQVDIYHHVGWEGGGAGR